jgi:hypothetical protein
MDYFSHTRDSLTLWVRDSAYYKNDSISLVVNYTVKDTSDQYVVRRDTLLFTYREKQSRSKREQPEEKSEEKLEVHTIRNNGNLDLNREIPLVLDFPLERLNDTLFALFQIPDTVEVPVPFVVTADTLSPYRATLTALWEPGASYRMVVHPGAITSIYPMQHDTIDMAFKTREVEYYGQILLSLHNVKHQMLVELFSGKNRVLEKIVERDGQYVFPFLKPQEYHFKFIHDPNQNGKWDTGNYLEKLQPESVELFPGKIEVRANWDHDVSVTLEK